MEEFVINLQDLLFVLFVVFEEEQTFLEREKQIRNRFAVGAKA